MMANFTLTRGMKNNDLLVEIKERLAVSQGSKYSDICIMDLHRMDIM
jgi:hypothetical protein